MEELLQIDEVEQYQTYSLGRLTMHPEQGSASRKMVIGLAATALVVGGVVYGGKQLLDRLPHQEGAPKDSRISAEEIKLVPIDLDCKALSVYDTKGSTVRTHYVFANKVISFTGYGAKMEAGKVVKQGCVKGDGVTIKHATVNGNAVNEVDIKVSAVTFDTTISSGDTRIVQADPPVTKIVNGAIDITSGLAETACNALSEISLNSITPKDCAEVNIVSNWNATNQEVLRRSLEVNVLDFVQKGCGKAGWDTEKKAFADGYRLQAKNQGGDPDAVVIKFVDNQGNLTTATPDFSSSVKDQLFLDGTLHREQIGAPELEFDSMTCVPLKN